MKHDRISKVLLAAIALGLWANVAAYLTYPKSASAQDAELAVIASRIGDIQTAVGSIAKGT